MRGKSFLVGFFIGGAAVGISTLLTVPNSGKNTLMNMKANTDVWIKQFSKLKTALKSYKRPCPPLL